MSAFDEFKYTSKFRGKKYKSTRRTDEPIHGKRWKRSKENYIWVVYRWSPDGWGCRIFTDPLRKDGIYDEPTCCSSCEDKFILFTCKTYQEALLYVLKNNHGKQPWNIVIRKSASDYCH